MAEHGELLLEQAEPRELFDFVIHVGRSYDLVGERASATARMRSLGGTGFWNDVKT